MATTQCIQVCRYGKNDLPKFTLSIRKVMFFSAGLSIPEIDDLLGVSHTMVRKREKYILFTDCFEVQMTTRATQITACCHQSFFNLFKIIMNNKKSLILAFNVENFQFQQFLISIVSRAYVRGKIQENQYSYCNKNRPF